MSRKAIINRLDSLVRKIVRLRDDSQCQWCGKLVSGYDAQTSHVNSRQFYATRWALPNVKLLCGRCHAKWHDKPVEALRWFNEKFPERQNWIEHYKYEMKTWRDSDLLELEAELKTKLKEFSE